MSALVEVVLSFSIGSTINMINYTCITTDNGDQELSFTKQNFTCAKYIQQKLFSFISFAVWRFLNQRYIVVLKYLRCS
jgi:hypothetical protein